MFSRKERTMRDDFGGIVTNTRLFSARNHIGFEKKYFPNLQVSQFGWERAYETGFAFVTGGPAGVIHAPWEISRFYERLGVEHFMTMIFSHTAHDVEIWLSTSVFTFPGTNRARKIVYRFDGWRQKKTYGLYQASLTIEDKISDPAIIAESKELMLLREWYRALS